MSDVPHLKTHSIDKNVLGTKSATSSYDFLLKGLPPFWLQRLWQVCNRVLIAADLRRAIADRLRISDLPKFILLSTLYILYRLKLRLPRNNPSLSIRTGENLVLRKTYFSKDFSLTGRRVLFIYLIVWWSHLVLLFKLAINKIATILYKKFFFRELEVSYPPRYNSRRKSEDDDKWLFEKLRFTSPPVAKKMLPAAVCDNSSGKHKPLTIDIDIQSLSLSPPTPHCESAYLMEFPSL